MEIFTKGIYQAGMLLYLLVWIFLFFKKQPGLGKSAIAVMGAAFGLHTATIILYSITMKGLPLDTPNQDALIRIWEMGILLLVVSLRYRHKLFPQAVILAILLIALAAFPMPLPSDIWMCGHFKGVAMNVSVVIYDLSVIGFAYTFSLSAVYFGMKGSFELGGRTVTRGDIYNRIHTTTVWGLAIFVVAQIVGSVGILSQYGTYWFWCPVHVLFVAIWLFYAGMIHLKWATGFPKTLLPVCGLIGFIAILGFRLIWLV